MPERAHVSSLEALEAFRAALIIYLSKARPALEEINSEMTRVRVWLQTDQRTHWERELRKRSLILEQAQQALFSARLAGPGEPTDAEQVSVRRARRAVDEVEEKLRKVKRWSRDFDSQVEPLAHNLDQVLAFIAAHLPQAAAYLDKTIRTLADYADTSPLGAREPAPPSAAANPSENMPITPSEPMP